VRGRFCRCEQSECLLQQLIIQKAADDMRKQQEQAAEEKEKAIAERVPKLELDGLDQSRRSSVSITWHCCVWTYSPGEDMTLLVLLKSVLVTVCLRVS